ncbi:ABC-type sugar transport system [Halomicronema hongdechloris C2206]|uniref:ABC-type sugar transport system n=1 Tax=Halomicronema hongdechloris C2206 TaxID=1641165 RepID=A0A1Z3HNL7_9CYAN|nr:ABC transporter ATP-binding protein [Halomicronema hongdechloris]ASC71908.1 ABC-type sugar transport system [Halomicronema hongdechloris C2206]
MTHLVIDQLYKTFPAGPAHRGEATAVLRRINLTVHAGEFMVLVGPSGCGKSTLLRLLAGLETVTAGTLSVGGRRLNELPPKQRNIAMVFQSYALYPHLTVYDNLAFGLRRMRGPMAAAKPSPASGEKPGTQGNQDLGWALSHSTWWREALTMATRPFPKRLRYVSQAEALIDQRVRLVARMLQIEPLLNRHPRQLSGGQKQRVALGRAMARNPEVFLMDEPLSNLDAKLRVETRAQIVTLQRQLGITTLYVTHDQVEAMTMGDRIAVMHQGELQQVAPPLELYNHPANRFVAEFIGSPTMNFLPVQIKAPAGGWCTATSGCPYPVPGRSGCRAMTAARPFWAFVRNISVWGVPAPKNLPGQVQRLEALGSETYLTVTMDNQLLQARIAPDYPVQVGQEVWLAIAPEQVHLFDAQTEQAL